MNNISDKECCWIVKLLKWANKENIPVPSEYEWDEENCSSPAASFIRHGGGFPRNSYDILNILYVLKLDSANLQSIPKEIGNLSNLKKYF